VSKIRDAPSLEIGAINRKAVHSSQGYGDIIPIECCARKNSIDLQECLSLLCDVFQEAFISIRTSALPAAIIPCPNCGVGRFSFQSTRPLQPDFSVEDVVFECKRCGVELICTARTERQAAKAA
jgi:hypothetical protein